MYVIDFLNRKEFSGEICIFDKTKDLVGKIVVIESTTPLIAPFLINIKGLIVEKGGLLSHTAIFVRELDIPSIRLENATKILKDGQNVKITLDGNLEII